MKKKTILLIILCLFIFVGCGKTEEEKENESYVKATKKSVYIDVMSNYFKAVVNKVNEGRDLLFFSENTLYMVPVGNDAKKSCVQLEANAGSPFSDTWSYAYIGVVYNGRGYEYYAISEDAEGNGILFMNQKDLTETGSEKIYSDDNGQNKELSQYLKTQYKITSNDAHKITNLESEAFKEAGVSNIVYIAGGLDKCNYR